MVEDIKIKEAPQKKVFEELQKAEGQLKHVDSVERKDRSTPVIEKDVKVRENPMKEVLKEVPAGPSLMAHKKINKEVAGGSANLKPTEGARDASAPIIEEGRFCFGFFFLRLGTVIKKNPFPDVLKGLPKGDEEGKVEANLKPAENVHDASAPAIDPEAKVKEAPQKALFNEIKKE